MQILPGSRNQNTQAYDILADATSSQGRSGLNFDRILQEATTSVPAEITPVLDAVPDEEAHTRSADEASSTSTDAPYESYSEPLKPSTLDTSAAIPASDIRLTDAEVYKIVGELRKEGIDEKKLKKVTELVGHPGGVTVRDVVKAIAQDAPAKLTEGDLVRIRSLADTLDPTGGLGDTMLRDLRSGDTMQAWSNLTQFVNALPADSSLSIDRDAVLSLGKAMRFDEKTLDVLTKAFGKNESAVLSPDGFKALMNPAQKSLEENFAAQQKVADKLEKVMTPIIGEARNRIEAEALASAKESVRVQQSRILIQDTVTKHGFVREGTESVAQGQEKQKTPHQQAESEPASGAATPVDRHPAEQTQNTAASSTPQAQSAATSSTQTQSSTQQTAAQKAESSNNPQAVMNAQKDPLGRESNTDESGEQGRQEEKGFAQHAAQAATETTQATTTSTKGESPWEAMLQRLNAVQGPGMVLPQVQIANAGRTGQQAALSRSVLTQIESGMMTAMQDGVNRLELQLNPLDLGIVNVVLTTRNGEVTALLRPERPETASLLVQQMEQMRINLEEQGLKVSKVDVQTQTGNDQGTSWQGTSQHNFAQEQQTRTLEIERFRRMARTHSDDMPLAADIPPSLLSRASAMGSSLNIVA